MSTEQNLQAEMSGLRSDIKHLSQTVRDLTQKLDQYPTLRDYIGLHERLEKVESNQSKAAWAIITAWIGGLGVVGMLIQVMNKIPG